MGREIKFRCFDKATNKMMFTGYHIIGEVTCFNGIDIFIHENPIEGMDSFQRYSEIEEMQYTGEKDRNDKEIYEGDILAPVSSFVGPMHIIFEDASFVLYHKLGRWGLLSRLLELSAQEKGFYTEVIGTIYENPELITPTSIPIK